MVAASSHRTASHSEVNMSGKARGKVTISVEECKGCGVCVESCPPKCLQRAPELSAYGVHPARYSGHGCTGCGICVYCCRERAARTGYRQIALLKRAVPHGAGPA